MIQLRSILRPADNTGVKRLRVMGIPGSSARKFAGVGDVVVASVIDADPNASVKKGQVVKVIIVRTRKETSRPDGTYVRFDDNAAVILEDLKNKNPIGTRVFGPIAREVKEAGFNKIASLAPEVV